MKTAYLWLNILTLLGPLLLSFDRKVAFMRKWRYFLPAILIPSTIYLIWDVIFTRLGIWKFNPDYVTGKFILNLPWEEYFFFIAIPYACLFIYECLRVYFPGLEYPRVSKLFGWTLVLVCAVALYFYHDRIYTAVTAILLIITLLNHLWVTRGNYLTHAFLAWLIALLPMAVVNGFLTGLPVLIYNDAQNTGIRIGTIPLEDFFYNLLLMIWMIWVFERYRQRPEHKARERAEKAAWREARAAKRKSAGR